MRYNITLPHGNDFVKWLVDNGHASKGKPARSPLSRLRRLFVKVFDEYFPIKTDKSKKQHIRPFHEIFEFLDETDKERALEFLEAARELAFDKRLTKSRTKIKVEPYADCRSALERYFEFYEDQLEDDSPSLNTPSKLNQQEENAIKLFIETYQKKEFTKTELYDNITFRRRTEGRYTGDVYYPIELIDTIFRNTSNNNFFEDWLRLVVDKIKILIDKQGNSIFFSDLCKDEKAKALIIENRQVYVFDVNSKQLMVYTRVGEGDDIKPLKVAIFESIDIDHTVAIFNMLNPEPIPNPYPYPVFKRLTELLKKDQSFEQLSKKKQKVQYLRKYFYKNNKTILDGMAEDIKNELNIFLQYVEFEMMYGRANKQKSKK